jgi:hypothetical protein
VGTRNDDISLILAKAKKQGLFPDVNDSEVNILTKEAKNLFKNDSGIRSFSQILSRFRHTTTVEPLVHPAPPTVTIDTSSTLFNGTGYGASTESVTLLGTKGTFETSTGKTFTGGSTVGIEFHLTGDKAEIIWVCQASAAEKIQIFVDDQPITATPYYPTLTAGGAATVAGNYYTAKLVFGSIARRKITFYANRINAFLHVYSEATALVEPSRRRVVIPFIGDSFFDYTGAIPSGIDSAPFPASLLLGAECIQLGWGGTGYSAGSPNNFEDDSRLLVAAKAKPDVIVISGSVNDDGLSNIKAKALSTFAKLDVMCPGVPIIVFGPQPTNDVNTISTNRSLNIAAVKAACDESPNVIAFYDRIGTLNGVPSAWNSGSTYNEGDLVTYLGAVWKWKNAGTAGNQTNPRTASRWEQVTWGYTGTGNTGSLVGDGTRDKFLHTDGVHPTASAALADAVQMASKIREALAQ